MGDMESNLICLHMVIYLWDNKFPLHWNCIVYDVDDFVQFSRQNIIEYLF